MGPRPRHRGTRSKSSTPVATLMYAMPCQDSWLDHRSQCNRRILGVSDRSSNETLSGLLHQSLRREQAVAGRTAAWTLAFRDSGDGPATLTRPLCDSQNGPVRSADALCDSHNGPVRSAVTFCDSQNVIVESVGPLGASWRHVAQATAVIRDLQNGSASAAGGFCDSQNGGVRSTVTSCESQNVAVEPAGPFCDRILGQSTLAGGFASPGDLPIGRITSPVEFLDSLRQSLLDSTKVRGCDGT